MTAPTTGRMLVLLGDDGARAARHLTRVEHRVLPRIGVAIAAPTARQIQALWAAAADPDVPEIVACEPERIVRTQAGTPIGVATLPPEPGGDYVVGYQRWRGRPGEPTLRGRRRAACAALRRGPTAPRRRGVAKRWPRIWLPRLASARAIAVLDTGLALAHPDFVKRANLVSDSFVEGEPVEDGNGHGSHCCGVVAGPAKPSEGPRFGVAPGAGLYVGKVLANSGSGTDGDILAGLDWAVAAGCHAVSMSLGATVGPDEPFSQVFETVARRALEQGTVIVAAAGNDSRRSTGTIAPVSHPANCPSIIAVGAVDRLEKPADFSNGTVGSIGQVAVTAPGVDVRSIWSGRTPYRVVSGTSMATPHVAGVAALLVEAFAPKSAYQLADLLVRHARRLALSSLDGGAGMPRWFAPVATQSTAMQGAEPTRTPRTQSRPRRPAAPKS